MVAIVAISLGLLGNLGLVIWGAAKLFTTVRFMDKVLETAVKQQKAIAAKQSEHDGRIRVLENRAEIGR